MTKQELSEELHRKRFLAMREYFESIDEHKAIDMGAIFKAGFQAGQAAQWISVEDRLPKQ